MKKAVNYVRSIKSFGQLPYEYTNKYDDSIDIFRISGNPKRDFTEIAYCDEENKEWCTNKNEINKDIEDKRHKLIVSDSDKKVILKDKITNDEYFNFYINRFKKVYYFGEDCTSIIFMEESELDRFKLIPENKFNLANSCTECRHVRNCPEERMINCGFTHDYNTTPSKWESK